MTWEDVTDYLVPALYSLYGTDLAADARRLEVILARNEYQSICYPNTDGYGMTIAPDYKAELQAIAKAGPHAKTILKIILIRKGLEP